MGLASIRVPLTRVVGRMDARPIPTEEVLNFAKNLLTKRREYDILITQTGLQKCNNVSVAKGISGSGSVVEHLLAKEKVAGSIPVSRSPYLNAATSPSGKARLCKSCTSGSSPLVASL